MKAIDGSLHTCPKEGGWGPSKAGSDDRQAERESWSSRLTGFKRNTRFGEQNLHPLHIRQGHRVSDENILGPSRDQSCWSALLTQDAVFTAVSPLVLLNLRSQPAPQARLSHPSPIHRVRVLVKTRKWKIYSMWPHWMINLKGLSLNVCPMSRGLREGSSQGGHWTKVGTGKVQQLDPRRSEDQEPWGCVRKEG